jgi:hypothetical protein
MCVHLQEKDHLAERLGDFFLKVLGIRLRCAPTPHQPAYPPFAQQVSQLPVQYQERILCSGMG